MSVIGNRVKAVWVNRSKLLSDPENGTVVYGSVGNDEEGNIYTVGTMIGEAKFGQFVLNTTENTPTPFITKQNQCGEFIYAVAGTVTGGSVSGGISKLKKLGEELFGSVFENVANPAALGVTISVDDGLYIGGSFIGDLEFNGVRLSNQSGGNMLYVVKLNKDNGEAIWGNATMNVSGDLRVVGMTADDQSLYLTGRFIGEINFGTAMINSDSTNFYVTKINKKRGKFIWASQSSETNVEAVVNGVDLYIRNNVLYSVGSFFISAQFGSTEELVSLSTDAFVVAINSCNGDFIKAVQTKTANGNSSVNGMAIIGSSGEIFITGYFGGEVAFGKMILTSPTGIFAVTFISKLNKYLEWVETVAGDAVISGASVDFNAAGSIGLDDKYVYVAGIFIGNSKFGNIDPLISVPNRAFFLVRLSRRLKFDTAFQSTNLNLDGSQNFLPNKGLTVVDDNIVVCLGVYTGSTRVGQLLVESDIAIHIGDSGQNVWVAQLQIL
ncbi:MAG: hypothetical protein Hyperionvirus32_10 [Hyperionvirus sp.]|uniref:Uncharacterized protein n=1 Tax=Hyperionvirus sp. TaxID=2487770 RepID=A0A3G5AFI1_9VIRU|nr:MAG: hypothetical protein Hyperionvirus32_10 [Hyperionvirus sp.]